MHVTLRQLSIFVEVLKSGSTTQASSVLALSQSAVSASLSDLEEQLKVALFDRVGKRLVVNENGRLLYPKALALLERATEIEQLFNHSNGALRIAASTTIGNYILPETLALYRKDFPQTPLELTVGNSREIIQSVADFRVDMGFIEGPCHHPDLITHPWLSDELVVFASPENPLAKVDTVSLDALIAAPWILREAGSGTREVLEHSLMQHLPGAQPILELGNSEAIKHAVRHGIGISCLSRRVVAEQLSSGSLVELTTPFGTLERTLFLIYHRQKHLSASLLRFLTCCQFPIDAIKRCRDGL